MVARKTRPAEGRLAVAAWLSAWQAGDSQEVDTNTLATATRFSLESLEREHAGRAVEVRVPPFAAVQCIAGPTHTRGTPSNVIEMDAHTWLALATGQRSWADAVAAGEVSASGVRADLSQVVPLANLTE